MNNKIIAAILTITLLAGVGEILPIEPTDEEPVISTQSIKDPGGGGR